MDSTEEIVLSTEFASIALAQKHISHLGLAVGDSVRILHVEDGVFILPCEKEMSEQLRIARQVMQEDDEALRRLAQS
jgi:hypothetical protein